jgi:5-methylthioribose kinase
MAMRFTSALYEDTQHEPMPWRWLGDTAKRAGIQRDDQFKRAFEVAEAAGWLIVHDGNSVKLTFAGIRAVRRFLGSAEDVPLDVPALPAQPFPSLSKIQLAAGT